MRLTLALLALCGLMAALATARPVDMQQSLHMPVSQTLTADFVLVRSVVLDLRPLFSTHTSLLLLPCLPRCKTTHTLVFPAHHPAGFPAGGV